ncbi:MAG: UDP-glucose/GDP-mannose dehydrogenase family protein [Chloroflexi bacterium]|nr:MAG: UDP-glucose 6-dehydrogenase [Actinobacteria bacterium 13_2_20CM_2_66_6]TMD36132.1 MAG: UDP-glucose/GDP-mannose dehydrogenase family protein [Chloroflexota bacterium]TMD73804.1 MAG: UDP-glucose/GDP-mannose dehydrogenase family protein [Chloroflexota bacterium]
MTKKRPVSVIGLGKLGAVIAACFADKGFSVVGADVSARTVDVVNKGKSPVIEPGLEEMMARAHPRLRATQDINDAVQSSEATFIVVPTPSTDEGGFSISYVLEAARSIGRALRKKSEYHLVVLTSTVLPGSTEYGMIRVLEQESGKRCGDDFGVCYSPEFIALGQVIRDFLNPEFLLIGEFDERSGDQLAAIYTEVCDNEPAVARMSLVNAELTKISVNAYVTMRISFANMVAALSEQLPGGDVDTVTAALGLDTRIGRRYLKGAVAYGGPCFPRDNQALAYLARQLGQRASLAEAVHQFNGSTNERLAARVLENVPDGGSVAVLGLSYKPDSNVIEESAGFLLAKSLVGSGASVTVHDPMAMDSARGVLGDQVIYASNVDEAIKEKDVIVIMNPDRAYADLDMATIPQSTLVIDAWRILRKKAGDRPNYVGLGLGDDNQRLAKVLAGMWSDPARARA